MSARKRKRYTAEFRAQAVELAEAGRPVQEVAADLEIEISCLYSWIRKARAQATQFGSAGLRAGGEQAEADEVRRLRRENAQLRSENNILKKAAVILGTIPPSSDAK